MQQNLPFQHIAIVAWYAHAGKEERAPYPFMENEKSDEYIPSGEGLGEGCFGLLKNYTTLKQIVLRCRHLRCFGLLKNYTTLKPIPGLIDHH